MLLSCLVLFFRGQRCGRVFSVDGYIGRGAVRRKTVKPNQSRQESVYRGGCVAESRYSNALAIERCRQ